jgi:transposase
MPKRYHVRLEPSERAELLAILKRGRAAAHRQRHARILLKTDENQKGGALTDSEIANGIDVSEVTVQRVRRIFVEHGFRRALERKDPDRCYRRKLDGRGEAQLLALACEDPPKGRQRWTMKLLAEKLVELEVVESIGEETVRTTLKKMKSSPGKRGSGA